MAKIKYHKFRKKIWKIQNGQQGFCDGPHVSDKTIIIPLNGDTQDDLSIAIHEALHANLWDLDEEVVTECANDMSRFLWRLGWRKFV